MTAPGPALRAGLTAVAVTVIGLAVVVGLVEWQLHRYEQARARATATAVGTVVEDGIGDAGDVVVRWADAGGGEHVQQFGIYATDLYVTGSEFVVAYDPDRPAAPGFPADPEETAGEDDITAPEVFGGLGAVLLLLGWAVRGRAYLRAAARPGRAATATVLVGDGRPPLLGSSWWLRLDTTGDDAGRRWQRVMWHPQLDSATGPLAVTVRGPSTGRRRSVVELAGGTRLVPIGRLRSEEPDMVTLRRFRGVRVDAADAAVLPAGATPPVRVRWRRGLLAAALGAAAGAGVGLVIVGAGPVGLTCLVVAATVLLVNSWALAGAGP